MSYFEELEETIKSKDLKLEFYKDLSEQLLDFIKYDNITGQSLVDFYMKKVEDFLKDFKESPMIPCDSEGGY